MVHTAQWSQGWYTPLRFPLAVKLAKGERLALAPILLGSLIYRLDECVHNLSKSMGRYTMVSYANSVFLQLFLWERFNSLAPQSVQFEAVTMMTVEDEDEIVRTVPDKPARLRAQRWSDLKQQKGKDQWIISIQRNNSLSVHMAQPRVGCGSQTISASFGKQVYRCLC